MYRFWNSVLRPAFDVLQPRRVVEIGCDAGKHTRLLAAYCLDHGAVLTAIDPFPRFDVEAMQKQFGQHIIIRKARSLEVLSTLPLPDIVLLDGDHNWYTVFSELQALLALAGSAGKFPVVFLHDTSWPYDRRDLYYLPEDIPEHARQPMKIGGLLPHSDELVEHRGLNPSMCHAVSRGGSKNGVLTALEDFLASTNGEIEVRHLPGLHGLSIVFSSSLPERLPAFRTFLQQFEGSDIVRAHLQATEQERIHALVGQEEAIHRYNLALAAQHQASEYMKGVQESMRRMQQTASWRITAPLRTAMTFVRSLPRRCRSLLKKCWTALGQPIPTLVRFVRHRFFQSLFFRRKPDNSSAVRIQKVLDLTGGVPSVSVIVAARNNGAFIKECLSSIFAQSLHPFEVIYCDDGSTDDSLQIVRSIPGVRIIAQKHAGVAAARNAGVAVSTGSLLLHVDGDDRLTPDYIAIQTEALLDNPDAVFAYGDALTFGTESVHYVPQDWSSTLWRRNHVNTSSMIRRSAFEAVGGWRDIAGTMWDWDLFLRLGRIGRGVRTSSVLSYRRHVGSWSAGVERQMSDYQRGLLQGRVRRAVARISICAVVGGRLPDLLPAWIDAIARSVRAETGSVDAPEFVVLSHNGTPAFNEQIRVLASASGVFRSITVIPHEEHLTWKDEMDRRHVVARFLATSYNRLLATADGEILWFVEDDIGVPEEAYSLLLRDVTDGAEPVAAASGLYRNRHTDAWVAHTVDKTGQIHNANPSGKDEPFPVDLAGTGCLMIFRPFAPVSFASHYRGHDPAHDWAWSDAVRASGQQILLDPRVRCPHYIDTTTSV